MRVESRTRPGGRWVWDPKTDATQRSRLVVAMRLKPRPERRFYFDVLVYRRRADMYRAFAAWERSKGNRKPDLNFLAVTCSYSRRRYTKSRRGELADDIGRIYFCLPHSSQGIIAHEMVHASMAFERLVGRNPNGKFGPGYDDDRVKDRFKQPEERLAYQVGHLVSGMARGMREAGYALRQPTRKGKR